MTQQSKNLLIIMLLIAVLVAPSFALAAWWNPFSWGLWNSIFHFQKQTQKSQTPIVGNDKDAHGCIGSAGYSWCQTKQKCLRPWEEDCNILSDVYPLFSNLKWSSSALKNVQNINGYEITTTGQINSNGEARNFFNYYDQKLKAVGWAVDNNFAADGILGSQVGYKKDNNYIVLSYNIKPGKVISGENEPLQWTCPCDVTYSIFTSDASNQTGIPSGSWKTYVADNPGFDLKYPSDWQNIDAKASIQTGVKNPKTGSYFSVEPVAGTPTNVDKSELIYINGIKAYKIYTELASPNLYFEVVNLFNSDNNEFVIQAYSGSADDNKTLEQILSTFKFLK